MNKQVKQIRDEVERLEKWSINVFTHHGGISTAIVSVLTDLLDFIDSIEEPEVNLEKENDETNAPMEYGKYIDKCLNEASKHFFSEGEDKYSVADLFYAGVRCGKKYGKLPKDAIVIEGICSDKDFIDTSHGILAFGAEEGSYRPFNDGNKVKITITIAKKE